MSVAARHCRCTNIAFKLGVNLGEIWHLTPLATGCATQAFALLLTAPPLRCRRVGSPRHPSLPFRKKTPCNPPSAINSCRRLQILRSLTEPRVSRLSEVAGQAVLNRSRRCASFEVRRERFRAPRRGDQDFSSATKSTFSPRPARPDDLRKPRPSFLLRLARLSEDSVLLSVRSGTEACAWIASRHLSIRANYLDIGAARRWCGAARWLLACSPGGSRGGPGVRGAAIAAFPEVS